MCCKGHQGGNGDQEPGNKLADGEAKMAAEQPGTEALALIPTGNIQLPELKPASVKYCREDLKLISD